MALTKVSNSMITGAMVNILDYGADKKEYLKQLWKIIDWNRISTRWGKSL